MSEPILCGRCGKPVAFDEDHVAASGDISRVGAPNDVERYYFHADCWDEETADWGEPA